MRVAVFLLTLVTRGKTISQVEYTSYLSIEEEPYCPLRPRPGH